MSCGTELPQQASFCFRCGSPASPLGAAGTVASTEAWPETSQDDLFGLARKARDNMARIAIKERKYGAEISHMVSYHDSAESVARAARNEMYTKYPGSASRQFSYLKEVVDGLLDDNLKNCVRAHVISKDDDKAARAFVKATFSRITDPEDMRSFLQSYCARWPCFQIYMGIAELLIRGYEGTL